jgi:tRNA(fMet)-specific endonuclease VapC
MYTTIEADIENGQVKGPEADKLPAHAHVLITLLRKADGEQTVKYDFSEVAGKLKWTGDAVMEQRNLRDEW